MCCLCLQDFVREYTDTLAHDALLELLNQSSDETCRQTLLRFCEAFLTEATSEDAQDYLSQHEWGPKLTEGLLVVQTFCKCVGNLFQATDIKSDALDVTFFTQYKGDSGFALATRQILTQPEPAETRKGPAGELRSTSREHLQSLVADVVKTAASHVEGQHKMDACLKHVMEAKAALKAGLAAGFHKHLTPCLDMLPSIRSSVRKGASKRLENEFVQLLLSTSHMVHNSDQCVISSEDLNALLAANKFFTSSVATCAEMHALLLEWGTKHNAALAKDRLMTWADSFVARMEDPKSAGAALEDFEVLERLLKQLPGDIVCGVEGLQTKLRVAFYFLAKYLQTEVGWPWL